MEFATEEARLSYWTEHVESHAQSGQSMRSYSAAHNISWRTLGYWKRKLSVGKEGGDGFATVKIVPRSLDVMRIHLPSGLSIECPIHTEVSWLRSVVEALGKLR